MLGQTDHITIVDDKPRADDRDMMMTLVMQVVRMRTVNLVTLTMTAEMVVKHGNGDDEDGGDDDVDDGNPDDANDDDNDDDDGDEDDHDGGRRDAADQGQRNEAEPLK